MNAIQEELILNNTKKKNKSCNFEDIEDSLKVVNINCRKCFQALNFEKLRNLSEDGEQFGVETLLYLQDKKRKLIYHNLPVIEFENLIAK